MLKTPQIGVDTIRFITTLTALKKELRSFDLEYEKSVSLSLMDKFKKEVAKANNLKKEDFELEIVSISKSRTLLGYILIKNNYKSISNSIKQKRSKNYKREIIFTGLNQPTKKHSEKNIIDSYMVLKRFVQRFKLDSFDLAIDGLSAATNFDDVFDDYINHRSNIQFVHGSYYLNNPKQINNPRFSIDKILVYDKFQKEGGNLKLPTSLENWKRLEVTIKTSEKLNTSLLEQVQEFVSYLSSSYYNNTTFDTSLLEQQITYLKIKEK